jgi:hypothetical protein
LVTKLQTVSELTARTMHTLTHSVNEWMSFLDSAAWLYKYPWHWQVMIYAQRPDATACASIELWNSAFRRWVNKGAKGIALIDDSSTRPELRYVFDVSDTNFNMAEKTGGEKTHKLTVAEMPSHNHSIDNVCMGQMNDNVLGGGYPRMQACWTATTSSAGNDATHNNLQPYITCYMWKRTA